MRRLILLASILALALALPSAQAADAGGQARIMACLQRLSDTAQAQAVRDELNGAAVQAGDLRACYRLLPAGALRQKAALLNALARKNDGDNGELWRYVMLKERDEGLRAMTVARSARAAGDAQTTRVLKNLLQDPLGKPGLRMRAALALADLGDESGVEEAVQELEKVKGETAPERCSSIRAAKTCRASRTWRRAGPSWCVPWPGRRSTRCASRRPRAGTSSPSLRRP